MCMLRHLVLAAGVLMRAQLQMRCRSRISKLNVTDTPLQRYAVVSRLFDSAMHAVHPTSHSHCTCIYCYALYANTTAGCCRG
jgi:hypothetical protein